MNALSLVLRIMSFVVTTYMLLCLARIFLSWLPGLAAGRPAAIVEGLTEPFLAPFRRLPFLKPTGVDLSPVAALAVLSAVSRAFLIASYGGLTVGTVLAIVVDTAWAPVSFLLSFFAILMAVRLAGYLLRWYGRHPAWQMLDAMVNPVLFAIKGLVYRHRVVDYRQGLVTGVVALVGARLLLGGAVSVLLRLLRQI